MWDGNHYKCTSCGEVYSDSYDTCPCCGAPCVKVGEDYQLPPMPIKCSLCGASLEGEWGWIGQKAECPYCSGKFIVVRPAVEKPKQSVEFVPDADSKMRQEENGVVPPCVRGRRWAVLGDIHANLEALYSVLEDCRRNGVTDYICTGDVVGLGAAPRECIDLVRSLRCRVVSGDQDLFVSSRQDLSKLTPDAGFVVEWTRRQLNVEEVYWLRTLPFVCSTNGITAVHASFDRPESFPYVLDHLQADVSFVSQPHPVCFHGHTHWPMIYEKQVGAVYRIDPQDFKLPIGRKYLVNGGSVGAPSDGDPRASYVLYDVVERMIRFRRVEYDVEREQGRMRQAGFPETLVTSFATGMVRNTMVLRKR